jgi:hypothetical protein
MSNIKKYKIDWDWKAEIHIEIDHDIATGEMLHEINSFWGNDKYRVTKEGSVLNAVLKMLAREAFYIAYCNDYNTFGVVSAFDYDDKYNNCDTEGWPKMDGSAGFKITRCETFSMETSDMTIKEG